MSRPNGFAASPRPLTRLAGAARRRPELVRGPKLFWMIWGGTNTLGSAAYRLFGRKKRA